MSLNKTTPNKDLSKETCRNNSAHYTRSETGHIPVNAINSGKP